MSARPRDLSALIPLSPAAIPTSLALSFVVSLALSFVMSFAVNS